MATNSTQIITVSGVDLIKKMTSQLKAHGKDTESATIISSYNLSDSTLSKDDTDLWRKTLKNDLPKVTMVTVKGLIGSSDVLADFKALVEAACQVDGDRLVDMEWE